MNKDCYNIMELYNNNKPIFENNVINATYILHLEGNGRYNSIINQLYYYRPSEVIYLFINKGYNDKCKKLYKRSSNYDLIDAYINIYHHAYNNNYNTILILEDDFIFSNKINNKEIIKDISNFIKKNNNNIFIYYLGTFPFIQLKSFNSNHNKIILNGGSHSVIYTRKCIEYLLKIYKPSITFDYDLFINKKIYNRYAYNIPLCYQLFPKTENRKNFWSFNYKNINTYYLIFSDIFIKYTKLDKNINPGYKIAYKLSKITPLFIITLIILIIYVIINYIKI